MNQNQKEIRELVEKYRLETDVVSRYIDFVSEVGELGKELLKGSDYGKEKFEITDNTKSEIGDAFFSLLCICNSLQIDANEAIKEVIEKYTNRFEEKGNIGSGR